MAATPSSNNVPSNRWLSGIPAKTQPPLSWHRFLVISSGLIAVTGMLVILGWLLNIPALKSVLPGLATMKFNTALGFVLAGSALWFARSDPVDCKSQKWARRLAWSVIALALLTLGESAFGWQLGLDELVVRDLGTDPTLAAPGRMSGATALCFLFFGLALAMKDLAWRHRYRPTEWLALTGLALSCLGLLGYLFDVGALYTISAFSSMALHTCVLFILLGLGILFVRTDCGLIRVFLQPYVGGYLARRILPVAILLPVLLAWLRLRGEETGLYHMAVGVALMTLISIVLFGTIIWFSARSLNLMHFQLEERNLANARFAAIVESSVDAIVGKDMNGIVTSWNPGAEKVFGYLAPDMIGQSIKRLLPPDRLDEEVAIMNQLRRGESVPAFETKRRCKDGRLIDVSVAISPIRDETGRVVGASNVTRDITELKKMQTELRRSNQDLEQFAYVASHDLQEPLRAVAGCLQILQRRYQDQLAAPAHELIGHAVDGAGRMQSLIEGLLAFSRVDTKGGVFKPVEGQDVLDLALKNLSTAVKESQAIITHDDLPRLQADRVQLSLVFQNLISNALKFRGDAPPQIHIGAENKNGAWVLTVRDNGIGISPEYFERIFAIFQRLHTRREYPGTGIGLALCKKIVERHGGRIWVDSTPGHGSTFSISLPDKTQLEEPVS